jgi:hypothetical protein
VTTRLRERIPAAARPWLACGIAVALAGLASIGLRQDSSWDLQNYHLYNAWALVHQRFGLDWAPAQLQSFYSPYLDLPFYALFAADAPPKLIAFALAIPTGIGWYFFARIAALLFADRDEPLRGRATWAAIALGVTAPMPISLIGTTMNDWYVAAAVLAALWLVLRNGDPAHARARAWAGAGLLVGAAAGLKLTGAIYGVGLLAAALAAGGTRRWRAALASALAMGVAFAVTAGPWMATMYARYGNPLFPYFNDVFRSPWTDPVSYSATRFGPATPLEWLVFPYLLLVRLEGFVAEPEFRDARLALLYTLALAALALFALQRRRSAPPPSATRNAWRCVIAFWLASFAAWAVLYRIARYLVPLELLAGALTAGLVVRLVPARRAAVALVAALALVVVTARFPTWWRQPFEDRFLAVQMPPVKPGALVLLVNPEPMSYVLPAFPADARFAGLVSNFNDPSRTNLLQRTIAATIRAHRGPLYALAAPPGRDLGAGALAQVGLARDHCTVIRTNLRVSPLELCELTRMPGE